MKNMRKFVGLLLTLVMVFAMTATAFAADTTISVGEDDTRSYDVYQIFTGDLKEGTKILSNVKWGQNGTGKKGEKVSEDIINALKALNGNDAEKAKAIKGYVNFDSTAVGTVSAGNSLTVSTGYYLLADKGPHTDGEAYSLYIVQVVGPTTVAPKVGEVESYKKVKDVNDSEASSTTDWQDSADYDIEDDVPFQLTGTIPVDYVNYDTYYYAFHDKESTGLTFDSESVKVYVDDVEITSGYEIKTNTADGCTFEVVFANLKNINSVKAGSTITVEYTSKLNENAKIGATGNPNEMHLEYSNNPNTDSKGTTVVDKVTVFTYKVVVNKYDDKNKKLAGAEFKLEKILADGSVKVIDVVKTEDGKVFTFSGLDDGNYRLTETVTPAGYNTIDPIEFTVTAMHEADSVNPKLTALTGNAPKGEITFTASGDKSELSTDVINKSGATLPETGGIGTTMFYVIGAILVVGAGVVLITRRRMSR